jgi:hypothetical protein
MDYSPINWDSNNQNIPNNNQNGNNNIPSNQNENNNIQNKNIPLQKLTDTQEVFRSQPILVNIYNCVNYK